MIGEQSLRDKHIAAAQQMTVLLAEAEHASWARWMTYLLSKCEVNTVPGSPEDLVIPAEYVNALRKQMETPFADLTDREQEYDIEEVRRILPIIEEYAIRVVNYTVEQTINLMDSIDN